MKSRARLALAALAVLLVLTTGASAAVFLENFDSYSAGSQMHGQGGWKGWDNSPGAGALVSNAQAFSPPNSVAIAGPSDLVHEWSGLTSGHYSLSAQQYIPSGATGTTYFILLNQYVDVTGPDNWSVQVPFNMDAGTLQDDFANLTRFPAKPLATGHFVPLRADIDLDADIVSFYYGGSLLSTRSWRNEDPAASREIKAIDLYAGGATDVYYDDLRIDALIPRVNAALGGKTATQTSTHPAGPPQNGVDGNLGNFTHTLNSDPTPAWTVDLGASIPVGAIKLFNRGDGCCPERLRDIYVDLLGPDGSTVVYTTPELNSANAWSSPANIPIDLVGLTGQTQLARYVRVRRIPEATGNDDQAVLSLGEVEVWANNLALGKPATQTSDYGGGAYPAGNAVDGNLGDFSHTLGDDPAPALTVDLGDQFKIDSIILHNRDDCCGGRLRDIFVDLLGPDGSTVLWTSPELNNDDVLGAPQFLAVDLHELTGGPMVAEFVRVRRIPYASGDDGAVLALGELQVFGSVAPEPSAFVLAALGMAGLAFCVWRRKR